MTEPDDGADLAKRFPHILWTEPIEVSAAGSDTRLGCRICIARHGLRSADVAELPKDRRALDAHMSTAHARNAR